MHTSSCSHFLGKVKVIKKEEYRAKLVIKNIDDMTSVPYRKMIDWLERVTKELKKAKKFYQKILDEL